MPKTIGLVVLAALTLAGELVGQDRRPVLAAPVSISLDSALMIALPASEAVGIARAAVARARGEAKKSRGDLYPQLTGTLGYTRTLKSQFSQANDGGGSNGQQPPTTHCDQFIPDPSQPIGVRVDSLESAVNCFSRLDPFAALGNLPFGRTNQYNLGLQASWLLFAGGRVRAQGRAADANLRAAEIGLTSEEANLTLTVTRAYYEAALADQLLEIARATLELSDSTLEQTRLARQLGTIPEFDLLRAQVIRDNQRPVVIQREADRDIAYFRLKQLLSLPLGQPLELTTPVDDSSMTALTMPDSSGGDVSDSLSAERAPVRRAAQALAAQEQQVKVATSERWPTLTVTSNYAQIGYPDDVVPSTNDFVTDWNVGVAVKVPLFTGGRITGNVMSAKATLEESKQRYQATQELAAVDTRDAMARLRAAQATWVASQGTVEQAMRAYEIAEIRYREGISTQTELSDSRLSLALARANRAIAAKDFQVARVRVALLPELPLVVTQ
jgi:outer membrane protein TolC